MKRKKLLVAVAAMLCLLLCLTGCGSKASVTFSDGTLINGQDVSGLKVDEAANKLAESIEGYTFHLTMGDKSYDTTAEELQMTYNTEADLQSLLDAQNKDKKQVAFTVEDLYQADLTPLMEQICTDFNVEMPAPEGEAGAEGQSADSSTGSSSAAPADSTASTSAAPADSAEPAEGDAAAEDVLQVIDPNAPKNADLAYDAEKDAYVIVPDEDGTLIQATVVQDQILTAVEELTAELDMDMNLFQMPAEIKAQDLAEVLEEANARLGMTLTYTFTPDGGTASSETVSHEMLSKLFYYNPVERKLAVDEELLGNYVVELGSKYSVSGKSAPFRTTGGGTININVEQAGSSVDTEKLYADLLDCLLNNVGGTREAPYLAKSDSEAGYWGGNYVEIDQTRQHIWVYRDGKQVLSCDIISGCVANNTLTPNGCFKIFAKDRNRYLRGGNIDGTTYKVWVNYFMPFSGGCGLHDSGRAFFGGTHYIYGGTHGCVSMPLANVKVLFDNVSVGTHVVVYGGVKPHQLPSRVPDVSFGEREYIIEVGQTIDLGITTNADAGYWLNISKAGIVDVLSSDKIRGASVGEVYVACNTYPTSNFREKVQHVRVQVVPAGSLAKEQSISASAGTTSLTAGGSTTQISVSGNATAPSFSSSNNGVVTVDGNGVVTPVGVGSATVTVSCPAGSGYKAGSTSITFNVSAPEQKDQNISASAGTTSLTVGGSTTQISVSGNITAPSFSSESGSVISVDSNGVVTPVGEGTAKVYITCPAGSGYKEGTTSITFTVSAPAPKDQNVSVSATATNLTVNGAAAQISVSGNQTTPKFAANKAGVVEVSENGLVTPVGEGTVIVTITCPAGNGYKESVKSITFTVSAAQS